MYFNNNKNNTNIDNEFSSKNSGLFNIKDLFSKYKKIFFIGIIVIILLILMLFIFSNRKMESYLILNGEEIVTIYQGTDYIEPGYEAYNSRDNDLTNKVVIESNLNNNVIGEYEITYKIDDITKVRYVNVIKRPSDYVFIHLTSINNSVDVYLQKGEQYKEPGYMAITTSGKDLTNKVSVTGKVDTSKKGTYKLTYSVVDSNNVTISVSRKVMVLDSDISLSLNTDKYTNTDVTINAYVLDEYFDYMILPDNKKVTTNVYSYKVSNTGTYTFKVYSKKGKVKEKSIKVSNIDKVAPSGSCSGSYKDGVSTININAIDNIGIDRYVINGKSYTSNNITISSELKIVNVTIYDKAGNNNNLNCNLEDKNSDPITNIYTPSTSHTNSINGVKYLLYNQADQRWGDTKYPSGSTIADIGCLITSVAVVSSAYNETITPLTVFDTNRHNYPYTSINNLAGEGFKCQFASAHNSKDKILKALSEGSVVVIMSYGKNKGGASPFTSSQHYMALIDYKNDKIFIGNSYSDYGNGLSGWYNKESVLTSVQEVNICTPTQKLIDRFKK